MIMPFNFSSIPTGIWLLIIISLGYLFLLFRRKPSSIKTIDDLVEDEEALAASELEVSNVKNEMELWSERGYILIQTYGSSDGFSREYMFGLKEQADQQNLRLEVIEVNRSLVAMETGNFIGFKVLAHVDDERSVRKFLMAWFKNS